jgi:hypothetical protein
MDSAFQHRVAWQDELRRWTQRLCPTYYADICRDWGKLPHTSVTLIDTRLGFELTSRKYKIRSCSRSLAGCRALKRVHIDWLHDGHSTPPPPGRTSGI